MTAPSRNKPITVIVEGNIASGKTTLLNHFNLFDNITIHTEPVEMWRNFDGHNLLDLMYTCPKDWSMPFQSYVILTMLQIHTEETDKKFKLMERSIYSSRYCFIEKLFQSELMHPAKYSVLDKWFDYTRKTNDVSVDLIVYLRSSPDVVHSRIENRARPEEKKISVEYLEELHNLHEDWLIREMNFKCPAPVLVLDADLDLASINDEYEKMKGKMTEIMQMKIEETSSLQPSPTEPSKCKANRWSTL